MYISEIIQTLGEGDAQVEICATADTQFSASAQEISVVLDSFARGISVSNHGEHRREPWLPPTERVVEHVSREETTEFTRDVLQSWVRKVRTAIPHELRSKA